MLETRKQLLCTTYQNISIQTPETSALAGLQQNYDGGLNRDLYRKTASLTLSNHISRTCQGRLSIPRNALCLDDDFHSYIGIVIVEAKTKIGNGDCKGDCNTDDGQL